MSEGFVLLQIVWEVHDTWNCLDEEWYENEVIYFDVEVPEFLDQSLHESGRNQRVVVHTVESINEFKEVIAAFAFRFTEHPVSA